MSNFLVLFLVFTVYSFLGWLCESIFCSVPGKKFINRGFLNGPFCPVYGVGGVLVISVLTPFQNNIITLYFAGVLITTLLEYGTGFALEKIFRTKYWDYSGHKFNLQGRVCLENSLLFGVMCVVGILFIHPTLMKLLGLIPAPALPFVSGGFMLYFITDTVITVHTMLQLNGKLRELQQILDEIRQRALEAKTETIESLQAAFESLLDDDARSYLKMLYEKKEKIEADSKLLQRRVINAFPTMKSVKNNESLQRVREAVRERTKRIKRS